MSAAQQPGDVRGSHQRRRDPLGLAHAQTERRYRFEELGCAPIVVDAVYEGSGVVGHGADPLTRLVPGCSNQGGFRSVRGQRFGDCALLVLSSSVRDPDWPDVLDSEQGIYTYFGDNKRPGHELHDTPKRGNLLLRDMFAALSSVHQRKNMPPVLVFTKTGEGRAVRFRGLAVPSGNVSDGLVAIWRQTAGQRFQNYRARFEILDCSEVPRSWIEALSRGHRNVADVAAPDVWKRWVERGDVRRLRAPRTIQFRTKPQQLPSATDLVGNQLLQIVTDSFCEGSRWSPHDFEFVAAELFRAIEPRTFDIEITRSTVDGGRDAVGKLRIGGDEQHSDGIATEFALEAKCYSVNNGVGVKELSRLISRLRHRQFGVLVTTSYLAQQAYKELREDGHPVVVISGIDVVRILCDLGITDQASAIAWMERILA
jgi:hypothetical protein